MKFSIITVCYNAAATIDHTLRSVAAQNHGDIEHVVVDGGSTDDTLRIVANYPHVARLVSGPDAGIFDAMNKGLALATGDAIGFLNADDFFCRRDAVAVLDEALSSGRTDAVCASVAVVDRHDIGHVRRQYSVKRYRPWMLRFGHMPPHPAFYIRRPAFDRIGTFNTVFHLAGDFDIAVRLLLKIRGSLTIVPDTLVGFRNGGASTEQLSSSVRINEEIRVSLAAAGFPTSRVKLYSRYLLKSFQLLTRDRRYRAPDFF
ncbi:MAG: glycosyltransferase family 2 protein [Sphingomonas sp.]